MMPPENALALSARTLPSSDKFGDQRWIGIRWIAFLHLVYTAITFYWLWSSQSASGDFVDYTYTLCLVFTASVAWLAVSCYLACRSVYHPYFLFLLSAVLFNGGQLFSRAFRLTELEIALGRFSQPTLQATIILTLECLLSLHLGILFYLLVRRTSSSRRSYDDLRVSQAVAQTGYGLMLCTAVPYALLVIHQLRASAGGYEGLYTRDTSFLSSIEGVGGNLYLSGLIFALAGSTWRRLPSKTLLVLTALDIGVSLFVGNRARAMMLLCGFLFVWTRRVGRIPRFVTVGLLVGATVTLSVVAVARNFPAGERIAAIRSISRMPEKSNAAFAVLQDMGTTFSATAYTVELVPQDRKFEWGMTYARSVLFLTPGLGRILNSSEKPVQLAAWLIGEVDPVGAANNGGIGFSYIAEAYLNFGMFGAPIACSVIGFLIALLFFRGDDAFSVAVSGCALLCMPFFPRDESVVILRAVVWQCILPAIAAKMAVQTMRAKPRATADSSPFGLTQQG